jgi:biotin-dependent carboxylase-like uncharacterized protein
MTIRIDRCGWTTVQDFGRPGFAHLGVPHSGAADRASFLLANRLVGNDPNAAMFETSGGLHLTALSDTVVALSGAECDATVDNRPVRLCTSLTMQQGSTLMVERLRSGARVYVAVSGGLIGTPLLGSLSHDTLGGIAPLRLTDGTTLHTGSTLGHPTSLDMPLSVSRQQPLRVLPGPHHDWFSEQDRARFFRGRWRVSAASNRVGVRLTGVKLAAINEGEHESFPLVRGAIQMTPSHEAVIMLADHPTTGGYPVIGVLHLDDVDMISQCVTDDAVSFV